MPPTNFGIEIEFSGITRKEAADIVAKAVGGNVTAAAATKSARRTDASGRLFMTAAWALTESKAGTLCRLIIPTISASWSARF